MLSVIIVMILYHLTIGFVVYYFDKIKGIPRLISTGMYLVATHKETKFFVMSLAKFAINVGAGVASVSVVGYFIPPLEVATATLIVVGFFGIIMSFSGYYIERALKR